MEKKYLYFCGKLFPEDLLNQNYSELSGHISLAGNTFFSSILYGFVENDYEVHATSLIYPSLLNKVKDKNEDSDSIIFWFHKLGRNRLFNYLRVFKNVFSDIFRFHKLSKKSNRIVVFNVLKHSYSIPGLIICKLLRIKTLAIVTDVPGYRMSASLNDKLSRFGDFIGRHILKKFDFYVLLSENMANVIKKKKIKFVVVEGVYREGKKFTLCKENNKDTFDIMYAGSLDEEYGVMNLVYAFLSIKDLNTRLVLYGSGDAEDKIINESLKDKRIIFKGKVSHEEVIEAERNSSLLVNPRPVDDEYVKLSFPSKLMEYLASGTPVLATNIPSLPEEYKKHLFLIPNNHVETISHAIADIVHTKDANALKNKALEARKFIMKEKNEREQARKIISII